MASEIDGHEIEARLEQRTRTNLMICYPQLLRVYADPKIAIVVIVVFFEHQPAGLNGGLRLEVVDPGAVLWPLRR